MNRSLKNRTLGRLLISALALSLATQSLAECQGSDNTAVPEATPSETFFDFGDGTVLHRRTQLVWMRCALGQSWTGTDCSNEADLLDWPAALQAADQAADAGRTDWRLPNRNELASIVETRCHGPTINGQIFPATPVQGFWTSSPAIGLNDAAWMLDFDEGALVAQPTSSGGALRLVRAGRM